MVKVDSMDSDAPTASEEGLTFLIKERVSTLFKLHPNRTNS